MGATFTPRLYDWRWYADDAQDPTSAYANLNTTYSGTDASTTIFRLRWNVRDIGGKASNVATTFQYNTSTGATGWTSIGTSAAWNFALGQGLGNTTISVTRLASTTDAGEYIETAGTT